MRPRRATPRPRGASFRAAQTPKSQRSEHIFEYARAAVVKRGASNYLGLVLQWEPITNHDDAQWYFLGGPLWSLDNDDRPGSGFGAELGVGFSFRRRELPLLVEIVGRGLSQDAHSTAGLALQLGAVW